MVRGLVAGTELRFVWRRLPLTDVLRAALLAAEASDAAADQGKLWEMHDLLLDHQETFTSADLSGATRTPTFDQRVADYGAHDLESLAPAVTTAAVQLRRFAGALSERLRSAALIKVIGAASRHPWPCLARSMRRAAVVQIRGHLLRQLGRPIPFCWLV